MSPNFTIQSSSRKPSFHVAVIMDGNGRWATRRGSPRPVGHRAGAQAVRRIVEAAPTFGVTMLTLFAMSSDNFERPASEVTALLRLFAEYLAREGERMQKQGIRLTVIGRRDRLPAALVRAIEGAELATRHCTRLTLRLAIDYSARGELRRAVAGGDVDALDAWPTVDLLIRTGGERRLSDFLLWESAYAELWFTDRLWPDVTAEDLAAAVADFHRRDRRFGRISA